MCVRDVSALAGWLRSRQILSWCAFVFVCDVMRDGVGGGVGAKATCKREGGPGGLASGCRATLRKSIPSGHTGMK